MPTFLERLRQLGFSSYKDYLKSDHWFKVRLRLRNSRCLVCDWHIVSFHHVTYERLGAELDVDLRALCQDHHDAIHKMVGHQIDLTDEAIAWLRRDLGAEKYIPRKTLEARKNPPRKKKQKKKPRFMS